VCDDEESQKRIGLACPGGGKVTSRSRGGGVEGCFGATRGGKRGAVPAVPIQNVLAIQDRKGKMLSDNAKMAIPPQRSKSACTHLG
jgi:hypothetical protein